MILLGRVVAQVVVGVFDDNLCLDVFGLDVHVLNLMLNTRGSRVRRGDS